MRRKQLNCMGHGAARAGAEEAGALPAIYAGGFDPVPDAEEMEPAWLRSVGHFRRDIESKEQAQ